ncbi:MAG: tetratricopeptide repeat protein [Pyrinomonadaceae bacterium]
MLKPIVISDLLISAHKAQITGAYAEGLEILDFFWNYRTPGIPPNTEGLNLREIGELLLACGRLYGFYGISHKNAQEKSKDLLTDAYEIFERLGLTESQLLCSNYLAVAYKRMGEYGEARIWLKYSFAFDFPEDHPGKLHAVIVESLVDLSTDKHVKVLKKFNGLVKYFEASGDSYLLGLFYMNRGIAKDVLLDFEGALIDLGFARNIFNKAGYYQLLANCENNMACLYRANRDFENAFGCIERALVVARKIGDLRQIGGIYDSKALIALAAGDYDLALSESEKAIAELQKTECYGNLIEYYITKFRILLKLGKLDDALMAYEDAVIIAREFTSEDARSGLRQTVSKYLRENILVKVLHEGPIALARDSCQIVLEHEPLAPVSLVEILSNHNYKIGLEKGFIAVVEPSETKNGDFVAVKCRQTGTSYFGFIETFMGLVQITTDADNIEPLVFSPNVVEISGKVIGYCPREPDDEGILRVVPLNL